MAFAEHFSIQGSFLAPATLPGIVNVNCGFQPTKVELFNLTRLGDTSANFNWERVTWNSLFLNTSFVEAHLASLSTATFNAVTSNAITVYNGSAAQTTGNPAANVAYGAPITGTTGTKTTGQFTVTSTVGLQAGDTVVFSNNVVMTQLGGLGFQIATIDSSTQFTITNPGFLNTANFSNETGFKVRRVVIGAQYYPARHTITAITAANPAVVTTAAAHGLTVGQQVRIRVPTAFGMVQINNQQAIISAVTATTFTLGGLLSINSTAYTAFAWPATTSVPFTPAVVVPIGSGPTPVSFGSVTYNTDVLDDATLNQQFQGFTVGTNLLQTGSGSVIGVQAGDTIVYNAYRFDV